ncbi:MAG: hypothetical protein ACT6U0_05160 [Shinella sp.]|uniref:hypothetical protein n=1 Tax=Shinella sp. TaxID=1870904 RepID=UPI00403690FE
MHLSHSAAGVREAVGENAEAVGWIDGWTPCFPVGADVQDIRFAGKEDLQTLLLENAPTSPRLASTVVSEKASSVLISKTALRFSDNLPVCTLSCDSGIRATLSSATLLRPC